MNQAQNLSECGYFDFSSTSRNEICDRSKMGEKNRYEISEKKIESLQRLDSILACICKEPLLRPYAPNSVKRVSLTQRK